MSNYRRTTVEVRPGQTEEIITTPSGKYCAQGEPRCQFLLGLNVTRPFCELCTIGLWSVDAGGRGLAVKRCQECLDAEKDAVEERG